MKKGNAEKKIIYTLLNSLCDVLAINQTKIFLLNNKLHLSTIGNKTLRKQVFDFDKIVYNRLYVLKSIILY